MLKNLPIPMHLFREKVPTRQRIPLAVKTASLTLGLRTRQ